jgi:serine/threonine-protein kinase
MNTEPNSRSNELVEVDPLIAEQVARICEAFLADLEADRPADPRRLLADHPELASELRACLEVLNIAGSFAPQPPPSGSTLMKLWPGPGAPPRVLLREPPDPLAPLLRLRSPQDEDDPCETAGRYRLLGELARGGMGTVLKGFDPDLQRELAVKVLLDRHRRNPDVLGRFVEEAQIAGQLQHPGIVPVYEIGCLNDRRPYFAMKLVQGRTLAVLLHERTAPSDALPRFLGIFLQVAQTVAYAHARGVVHRDLKPSNVMVGSFGEVQVMDWGLAKVLSRGGLEDDASAGREAAITTVRSGSDSDHSQAGSVLGTPSYMAPEQARGEVERLDERADVFALGSMLCEILTGKPAYTGPNGAEIQRKASRGELVEASERLALCGADVDLIALGKECLAVEPENRLRDANVVAERLSAHQATVQERVRRAELASLEAQTRAEGEVKRRRLAIGLAASVLLIVGLSGGGCFFWYRQQQGRLQRVALAMREATLLRNQAVADPGGDPVKWQLALAAALRVDLLKPDAPPDTRREIIAFRKAVEQSTREAEADQRLLQQLLDIRSSVFEDTTGSISDAAHERAFRERGFDVERAKPDEMAVTILKRPTKTALALADALDEWSLRANQPGHMTRARHLLDVTRRVDPNPWRNRLRDVRRQPDVVARRDGLQQLAAEALSNRDTLRDRGVQGLVVLGADLLIAGDAEGAIRVLRETQEAYPADVWANFWLAKALHEAKPPQLQEAVRYYSIAHALRPETGRELARALNDLGRLEEAERLLRNLVRVRPKAFYFRDTLAVILNNQGRLDEAISMLYEVIRIQPDFASARKNLGIALLNRGDLDAAVTELREAVRLAPDDALAHLNFGIALRMKGDLDAAINELREAIRLAPDDAQTHLNLGNALVKRGDLDAAIAEHRRAIQLQPDSALAHYWLGEALWPHGRLQEALEELRRGHDLGSKLPDWKRPSGETVRYAERLVALERRLPDILSGADAPADDAERLDLVKVCNLTRRYAAAARLHREVLESQPGLFGDRKAQHAYHAARAAAMAGTGKSEDDPPPDDAVQERLRRQALEWLQGELAAWTKVLESADAPTRAQVVQALQRWKTTPQLAGVRDEAALAKLSDGERRTWRALWTDVESLLKSAGAGAR